MATHIAERRELQPPLLNDHEAALTKAAQRCLMTALDHSRAKAIILMDESGDTKGPILELPPQALRLVAQVLGALGDHRAITVVPRTLELTTTDAANYLNVSRPFIIKQLEANLIPYRKVGTHRRISYADLAAYKEKMRANQDAALQALSDDAQELGLEFVPE